jgi:hypothetical protein
MNRYANAGPISAGLASSIDFSKPLTVSVTKSNGALVLSKSETGLIDAVELPAATPAAKMEEPAAYPGLSDSELRRMIELLADQLSDLAAQNVEMRQRLTALEEIDLPQHKWTWAI